MTDTPQSIVVHIDRDLEELLPNFFLLRRGDISTIRECLLTGNMQEVKRIGHNLKGSGGGYGFDYISELGMEMEKAAVEGAINVIEECAKKLESYLQRVEIKFF